MSLDKLVEQPEARVFDIPSPDILDDVLPSMIGLELDIFNLSL